MKKKILIAIAVILAILIIFTFLPSKINLNFSEKDVKLQQLKDIAMQNSQANQLLQNPNSKISYSKLSEGQIQNFINSGQISSSASKEVYLFDIISSQNSGLTLFIDLENKNVLKSQTVVEVGTG
jgi:uncharacterized membrane protein YvbJ